jgi:hypothetical protein
VIAGWKPPALRAGDCFDRDAKRTSWGASLTPQAVFTVVREYGQQVWLQIRPHDCGGLARSYVEEREGTSSKSTAARPCFDSDHRAYLGTRQNRPRHRTQTWYGCRKPRRATSAHYRPSAQIGLRCNGFQNLIGNAIKYRSDEPPQMRLPRAGQTNVGVSAKTTQRFITTEYGHVVFEPFKRCTKTNPVADWSLRPISGSSSGAAAIWQSPRLARSTIFLLVSLA